MTYGIKEILRMEVAPSLGCTEPSAIALAAAAAASLLPGKKFDSIEIWVDPNIFKNAFAVSIPGAEGGSGLDLAAAMGALGGDPSLKLEVLDTVDETTLAEAKQIVASGSVHVNLLQDHTGLFVRAQIRSGEDVAQCVIEDVHDNITGLTLNGESKGNLFMTGQVSEDRNNLLDLENWLKGLSLMDLLDLLKDLDDDDLRFLERGIEVNLRLAEFGLKHGPGLGIGLGLEDLAGQGILKKDMVLAARILTSAASDARMSGAKLPAMSSGGSGNHGLTAILPIVAVRDYVDEEQSGRALEAVAISHLVTAYIKAQTGRLSAVCGCSVAAGAGAAAGVAYLLGGDSHHIAGAIKNIVGDLAGVVCDGAKDSCAMKLATAAGGAVQAALFSLHGIRVQSTDGIIGTSPEKTMENVGTLSTQGMIETDRTIIRIMLDKQFDV
jgi:L-cysteine desulfidase